MPRIEQVLEWRGREVRGVDGEKIGTLKEIFLDRETEQPEWAAVSTGLLGTRVHFVPLTDARAEGDHVRVGVTKAQVKDAPSVASGAELSLEEERRLYEHYGLDYGSERSDTELAQSGDEIGGAGWGDERSRREGGALGRGQAHADTQRGGAGDVAGEREELVSEPEGSGGPERGVGGPPGAGEDIGGGEIDDAMTRSEEELEVRTARRPTERVRLRKYIVTEQQTLTVPVQREEVRIEHEPITDANLDAASSGAADRPEDDREVTLHAEEPVVERRVVPKERVRLNTDTVTEERQVSEEIRKEQIDTEGHDPRGHP